jgi:CheY-like chemotaxis protein
MPGMDGVQFIQGLAAHRSRPALAIMSAASRRMLMGASLVASNLQVKVIGLISKPVNAAALRCLIDQLQALRQQCRRNPRWHRPPESVASAGQWRTARLVPAQESPEQWPDRRRRSSGALDASRAWHAVTRGIPAGAGRLRPEERLLWCVGAGDAAQIVWRQQGYDIPVSINLPTHLLNSHDLPDRIHAFVRPIKACRHASVSS